MKYLISSAWIYTTRNVYVHIAMVNVLSSTTLIGIDTIKQELVSNFTSIIMTAVSRYSANEISKCFA